MAERVVDLLQVVDIDHENGNRVALRTAARGQPRRLRLKVAAVKGARQRVDQRLLEDALVVTFPT
jgi:hypothetical protein